MEPERTPLSRGGGELTDTLANKSGVVVMSSTSSTGQPARVEVLQALAAVGLLKLKVWPPPETSEPAMAAPVTSTLRKAKS